MFLFLHLNMFVIGVISPPRVRVYILYICIYIPYLRDSFSLCFWKISGIKLRRPSIFLTSMERGLCWDHESLSCQDMLSPGKNVRSVPHSISQVPPLFWTLSTSPHFHLLGTSGWLRFHFPHHCWEILPWHWIPPALKLNVWPHSQPRQTSTNQETPTVGQQLFPKWEWMGLGCSCIILEIRVSYYSGNPGWHQRAAVTLMMLPLPAHPACAGLICTWWADLVYSWGLKSVKSNICLWTKDDFCLCDS